MKPQRRWMKSVLEESRKPLPAFPWARGVRRTATPARPSAPVPPAAAPIALRA